jgi:hypothetical protein
LTEQRLLDRMDAHFVPVLMNLDEERDWAYRHNVTLHPCIVFTDDAGEVWGSALEMETGADAILDRMQDTLDVMAELAEE